MEMITNIDGHYETAYTLVYVPKRKDPTTNEGSYFSFNCDKDGKVDKKALHPYEEVTLTYCLPETHDAEVREDERWVKAERVGRCHCGEEVYLDAFTNPCDCGADYDMSGNMLAPREQWGAETGEHWTECF